MAELNRVNKAAVYDPQAMIDEWGRLAAGANDDEKARYHRLIDGLKAHQMPYARRTVQVRADE